MVSDVKVTEAAPSGAAVTIDATGADQVIVMLANTASTGESLRGTLTTLAVAAPTPSCVNGIKRLPTSRKQSNSSQMIGQLGANAASLLASAEFT